MKKNLYIIWNENNNTDIPIIDEQHRAIISAINTLHYFITNNKESKLIESIIITLDQYTKLHFNTEEEIIRQINYPELKEHMEFHESLKDDMDRVSLEVKSENDPEILLRFLKHWWLNHICVEDRKYAEYMKQHE